MGSNHYLKQRASFLNSLVEHKLTPDIRNSFKRSVVKDAGCFFAPQWKILVSSRHALCIHTTNTSKWRSTYHPVHKPSSFSWTWVGFIHCFLTRIVFSVPFKFFSISFIHSSSLRLYYGFSWGVLIFRKVWRIKLPNTHFSYLTEIKCVFVAFWVMNYLQTSSPFSTDVML